MHHHSWRAYLCSIAALLLLPVATASAQYRPRAMSDPATGEVFHIEAGVGFWNPGAEIQITSQSLGIPGTTIDFKQDLGLQDQRFPQIQLVLRPARSHKFRFEYTPIRYETSTNVPRDLIFNGIRYAQGAAVTSTLDWKAYRFGYEFDFIARDRWFVGAVLDAKYTDINVTLTSATDTEFTHARAPIPTVGGIVRVYVVPNISITGEMTGFSLGWIPETVRKKNDGHYVDLSIYGTVNFTNNIGVQVGYRSFDVGYVAGTDSGSLALKGVWLGVVARY